MVRPEVATLAKILLETKALQFGEFVLSSGAKSSIYIDMRIVISKPRWFKLILALLASKLALFYNEIDGIVGVATAGIPWATGLALHLGLPLAYVRPEQKKHGMGKQVEGCVRGLRLVVVDDVATTGNSLAKSIDALRSVGGQPRYAIVIVDRMQGAQERLARLGVQLLSIAKLPEILEYLEENRLVDLELIRRAKAELYGGG
ncbi:MAG TPA: orotate phosphoribosyltransferase [Pyrodictium sp.]|nr:orotate phosphoribosyltransferase [Pyrodictium sp.]HIQ10837.1 orotate phosphoribosyltransferase [Pyrodictium sp.]HIQ55297.1 orotate phosphoribosyltransferase [Pyrodictium sp.]